LESVEALFSAPDDLRQELLGLYPRGHPHFLGEEGQARKRSHRDHSIIDPFSTTLRGREHAALPRGSFHFVTGLSGFDAKIATKYKRGATLGVAVKG
jgi:hypothetical protein